MTIGLLQNPEFAASSSVMYRTRAIVLPSNMLRPIHSHFERGDRVGLLFVFPLMIFLPFFRGGCATYAVAMMLGLITKSDCSIAWLLALVRLYLSPMITLPAFRLMRSD